MSANLDDAVPWGCPAGLGWEPVRTQGDDPGGLALSILDALHFRLCVLDGEGRIVATNRAWREFGADGAVGALRGHEVPCRPWAMRGWSAQAASAVGRAMAELTVGQRDGFSLEYECPSATAGRWFELRIRRLSGQGPLRLLMTHEDITGRRRALQAQERGAERLKELGSHLESVQEEQRAMLARELHDEVGAALTLLELDLASAAGLLPNDPALRDRFDGLQAQVQSAQQAVKRLASELRPATLDALGLMATIRWYVDQFSRHSGVTTTLQLPEHVQLSDVASIAVFRVLQEGLSNVVTHADASRVTVQVRLQDDELVLDITDNGRGVSDSDLQRPGSLGVIGMRERAGYLGGTLLIRGIPGAGTQLTLRIPVES